MGPHIFTLEDHGHVRTRIQNLQQPTRQKPSQSRYPSSRFRKENQQEEQSQNDVRQNVPGKVDFHCPLSWP